jgi:magnesium-transporting ATPase (P-type)
LVKRPSPEQKGYGCSLADLTMAVEKTQNRNKCEEVDFLNSKGGVKYIMDGLKTSATEGISTDTLENRMAAFGVNRVVARPPKTFCEIVMDTLDDFVMKILIVCAFINLAINLIFEEDKLLGSIDGVAILVAVVICTLVAAVNDYQKEK